MTADRGVIAAFMIDHARSTHILNRGYNQTIQAAYTAAADNDTIRLWGVEFVEDIVCITDKPITLSGGYNEAYTTQDGTTALRGSLVISAGTVTVDMLQIK
jgi:hypothetical protein